MDIIDYLEEAEKDIIPRAKELFKLKEKIKHLESDYNTELNNIKQHLEFCTDTKKELQKLCPHDELSHYFDYKNTYKYTHICVFCGYSYTENL